MPTSRTGKPLFSSILCPVDFSEHSGVALRCAATIARRTGATLHPLFVNDPLLVAAAAAAYNRAELGAASEIELQRFVTETLPTRLSGRIAITRHIALGKPAREILHAAQRDGHDLIVVGTKGLNGARRLLLGSTTAEVLRRARVPVLAVPPADAAAVATTGGAWPGRTVVAAIEFGPQAAADIRRAADVARQFRASLILAHIVPVPAMPAWLSGGADEHLRRSCAQAETAVDALRGEARGVRTTVIVRVGHPPDRDRRNRRRLPLESDRHGAARACRPVRRAGGDVRLPGAQPRRRIGARAARHATATTASLIGAAHVRARPR
ncbi:MAG: universal stress protein [Vicinamibacterales bacterium]